MAIKLPALFLWGASTSAFQIEGAWNEDGKGESVWDRFNHKPYAILNNDNADVACDHYHRLPEDVQIMKDLGLQAYRFSISWTRVLPQGRGAVNPKGLDFYDRLVDQLLAANILPNATLNHWDFPQALQDLGGWNNRDSADWFADYARLMFERLGDRVAFWATHNEPWVIAALGYGQGVFAPGIADASQQYQTAHHLLLSHGKAVQLFRQGGYKGKIGIVLNTSYHVPASDSEADRAACQRVDDDGINFFTDAIYRGEYPQEFLQWIGTHAPKVEHGDMALIQQPIDFLGINYYMTFNVAHSPWGGLLKQSSEQMAANDWRHSTIGFGFNPDGLTRLLLRFKEKYDNPVIYVTENGVALADIPDEHGFVDDTLRIEFLEMHLNALSKAIEVGANVCGYYAWSLLDNFEWAHGFMPRFGLVRVDYESGKRAPKQSAIWYRDLIAGQRRINER